MKYITVVDSCECPYNEGTCGVDDEGRECKTKGYEKFPEWCPLADSENG